MKRFICAVIILFITVTSAALINKKTIKTADEIINTIEKNEGTSLSEVWNKNKLIFSLVLTEEKTEKIRILFDRANSDKNAENELKEEMNTIKNVFTLNLKNIL